ncbi:MAG TPA: hypothetical protein VLM89_11715 [Phycisphaerae bacterium]|nr:hypothetical protein [Phycisphaerae bacterium]
MYARLVESSANTSDMVEYLYFKSSSDTNPATIRRVPVDNRDLLDYVENKVDTTVISKYDYDLDTLGRRTATIMTGTAFTGGSGEHHWDFGYNGRSELVGGNRRTGTDPGQGTDFSPNGVFDYTYDPIGNRTESNVGHASPAMSYTANNVNQYTATADPAESSAPFPLKRKSVMSPPLPDAETDSHAGCHDAETDSHAGLFVVPQGRDDNGPPFQRWEKGGLENIKDPVP